MASISKLCSILGCNNVVRSRGFCITHYNQMRVSGELKLVQPQHHMAGTPTYRSWCTMIARCSGGPGSQYYEHYRGRGIVVCERWRTSFAAFCKDMGDRPPKMTLDREDNDANYSCGKCAECKQNGWVANCRWATRLQQTLNRSVGKNNRSGRRGVNWQGNRWYSRIKIHGVDICIGAYRDLDEAAWMYDQYALQLHEGDAHTNFEYCSVPMQ